MKGKMKRFLSLMLAIMLVFGMVPMDAYATEGTGDEIKIEDNTGTEVNVDEAVAAATTSLPEAEVTKLGAITLGANEYTTWPSGDDTIDRPLDIVVNFKAKETLKEAQASPYGKWAGDFYVTVKGIEEGTLTADGCYLAGNYDPYGWVVVPMDGLVIEEGVSNPVVAVYDGNLTYENICDYVKDFTAAIHISDAILAANPNLEIELALKLKNPTTGEFLVVGDPVVYSVEDLRDEDYEAKLPEADVTALAPTTLKGNEYMVWPSGDDTIDRPLDIVVNFKAKESKKEAEASVFGKWAGDFYVTVTGIEEGTLTATGCYLAGNYVPYGWVVVPMDGLVIEEGVSNPVVAVYDGNLTYENICDYVRDFTAAIHISDEILAANPNLKIELALKLKNPTTGEFLVVGDPIIYTVDDLRDEEVYGLSGEGTEENPYLIKSVDDLIFFRDSVNAGETVYNADGVYVALDDNVNLKGLDWSVNIGDDANNTFDGIFDGKGYSISNLTSTETAAKSDGYICTGLFGAIGGNAVIKNLTINNVAIDAGEYNGNVVGSVVGFAYGSTGTIENVRVTGNISIKGADATSVGAIVGYAYDGSLTIKDCTVDGNTGSAITATSYVGGIVGYGGGQITVDSCTVQDIDVTANSAAAGGIAGILCGGKATNNTVKNVNVKANHVNWLNSAGIVVGSISAASTVSGTTFSNVTANGAATTTLVGSGHADKPVTPVGKVEATIGNVYYATIQKAVDVAKAGDIVTVIDDIEIAAPIEVPANKVVTLDLNGKTISQENACTAHYEMIKNAGTLTVKDSSAGETGKITFKDTSSGDASFGWGSYTIGNHGTLIVENGTIENTTELNTASSVVHMYCAIQQGSDAEETIINGGTISNATYRSVRVNGGTLTINGGTFEGQIWMQPFTDNTGITINDGTFAPTGADGSSVFVENASKNVELLITGGTFETKIGCSNSDALAGAITGGRYTEAAVNGTNSALLLENHTFVKDEKDGYYYVQIETNNVATVEDVTFATVVDAVEACYGNDEADTIVVIADSLDEGRIYLDDLDTLDLNGFKVKASRVHNLNGSSVVDNSVGNTGRLQATKIVLAEDNTELPILTEDGYAFIDIKHQSTLTKVAAGYTYKFRPSSTMAPQDIIDYFKDGAQNNEIEFCVRISWNKDGNLISQDFTFKDEMVETIYKTGQALILSISNVESLNNLQFTTVLKSTTGVEITGGIKMAGN